MLRSRKSRDSRLLSRVVSTTPNAALAWSHDLAGNAIATASFAAPSDCLVIESGTRIELTAPNWPVFAIAASAVAYPILYASDDWTDWRALAKPQYYDVAGPLARCVVPSRRLRPRSVICAGVPAVR